MDGQLTLGFGISDRSSNESFIFYRGLVFMYSFNSDVYAWGNLQRKYHGGP